MTSYNLCYKIVLHITYVNVNAWHAFDLVFSADPSTLQLVVRALVKKGYTPVIGAKVEVQVGSLPWKLVKDDGLGKTYNSFYWCMPTD